ncbi:MAG: hypothetical protein AAF942_16385 [Pseudomonadota bacterium]
MLRSLMLEIQRNGRLPMQREDHIYLYRERDINLLLRFAGTGGSTGEYSANEFDAYLLNLSHRPIHIPTFACSVDAQALDRRPVALRPAETLILQPHGLHFEPAFGAVLDLLAATPAAPILVVHSERRAWTTWTFNAETLEAEQRVSTDLHASRIQLAMMLLEEMGAGGFDDALEGLATSRFAGFVRWDAVKLLHSHDRSPGLDVLAKLAEDDEDPGIRQAAQKTLGKLPQGAAQ